MSPKKYWPPSSAPLIFASFLFTGVDVEQVQRIVGLADRDRRLCAIARIWASVAVERRRPPVAASFRIIAAMNRFVSFAEQPRALASRRPGQAGRALQKASAACASAGVGSVSPNSGSCTTVADEVLDGSSGTPATCSCSAKYYSSARSKLSDSSGFSSGFGALRCADGGIDGGPSRPRPGALVPAERLPTARVRWSCCTTKRPFSPR